MASHHVDVAEVLQSYSRQLMHEFRESEKASKLAYERGAPRESAVRKFLQDRLPARYGVGEGIVIDSMGGQSEQCDVVIYDRQRMPNLSTANAPTIWPCELVYGVVQVKSKLSKAELKSAVNNITSFKKLWRPRIMAVPGIPGFDQSKDPINPLFGALIAYEIEDNIHPLKQAPVFLETMKSVPEDHQLDAYCILSGCMGFRTREGERIDQAPATPELTCADLGEGVLAAFLLDLLSTLNRIILGNHTLGLYLRMIYGPEATL